MSTRDRVGTEIGLMTGRIRQSFANGRDNVSNLKNAVSEKTRRAARKTDYYVHDNAWTMIAATAGLAFVAGFLLSRRNQQAISAGLDGQIPRTQEKIQKRSVLKSEVSSQALEPAAQRQSGLSA